MVDIATTWWRVKTRQTDNIYVMLTQHHWQKNLAQRPISRGPLPDQTQMNDKNTTLQKIIETTQDKNTKKNSWNDTGDLPEQMYIVDLEDDIIGDIDINKTNIL